MIFELLILKLLKLDFIYFSSTLIFYSSNSEDYYNLFRKAGFVIGFRLHSAILACSLGVPFVNILLDLRHYGFSETMGITHWNIFLDKKDLGKELIKKCENVFCGSDFPYETIEQKKNFLREEMNKFLKAAMHCIGR